LFFHKELIAFVTISIIGCWSCRHTKLSVTDNLLTVTDKSGGVRILAQISSLSL